MIQTPDNMPVKTSEQLRADVALEALIRIYDLVCQIGTEIRHEEANPAVLDLAAIDRNLNLRQGTLLEVRRVLDHYFDQEGSQAKLGVLAAEIEEPLSSAELVKNAAGAYQWTCKVYDRDGQQAVSIAKLMNQKFVDEYGEHNSRVREANEKAKTR